MADDCIFCKIVAGEIPSAKVFEDDETYAFMDIHPWTRGHALVVPKRHTRNLYEVDDADLAATTRSAKRLAERMRDELRCDGVNLLHASEPAASQTVFHFHLHVIPRYDDDGLRVPARPQQVNSDELAQLARELSE